MIKVQLVDYVGKEEILGEIARIKELKNDHEFVELLYKKFHEDILNDHGFRYTLEKDRSAEKVAISTIAQLPPTPQSNSRISHKASTKPP